MLSEDFGGVLQSVQERSLWLVTITMTTSISTLVYLLEAGSLKR